MKKYSLGPEEFPLHSKGPVKFSSRWTINRPDGDLSKVGDTMLPRDFTARWEAPDVHTLELDIVTVPVDVDGTNSVRPVCQAIRVERNPAMPPLDGSELRRLPLRKLIEFACLQAAMRPIPGEPGSWVPVTEEAEAASARDDIRESRRRRRITNELLTTVADTYAEEAGVIDGVARKMHVSHAQAYRYVRMARARGLLAEEKP